MHLSKSKKAIFGAISISIITVIGLLAAELYYRNSLPGLGALQEIVTPTTGSDSRTYSLKPRARVVFGGLYDRLEQPVVWQINAQGIRSDRALPPRSQKFRIAAFGDSEAFGWSIPLSLTFQRRMERIDNKVEVINFGTPGYNAENIADHMKDVIPRMDTDFVLYILHKNDMNPDLEYSNFLNNSYLYLYIQILREKLLRAILDDKAKRRLYAERLEFLSKQVNRMIEICQSENVPLLIGFMHWPLRNALRTSLRLDCGQSLNSPKNASSQHPCLGVSSINIEHSWKNLQRVDGHMSQAAHQVIAEKICRAISGGRNHSCVPPN